MNLAILQARMSSTRLPGKVMAPVLGEPMIARQLERLRRSAGLDAILVATSDDPSDDVLARYCEAAGQPVYRGPLADVLDRFQGAMGTYPQAKTIVRLTADCPLADWTVVDAAIAKRRETGADYASNTVGERTFPHGLDVEVVGRDALERAWREAKDPYEREHVTPYLYRHPELFRIAGLSRTPSLAALRWTVDFPEDLEFVRHVYERLYPANPAFTSHDVAGLAWNSSKAAA